MVETREAHDPGGYERHIWKHVLTFAFTADVDIRVRVRGGGHTSQIYAIRQAIAKSIVSPPTLR